MPTILDRLPQLWGEPANFDEARSSALVALVDRVTALESIDFAGKKGSKIKQKKNCIKSDSCGFSCIRKGLVCRSEMKGKEKSFAKYLYSATGQPERSLPSDETTIGNPIYTIPPLSKIKPPSDKDIEKLQKESDEKRAIYKKLDPNDPNTRKSEERKASMSAEWALSQAETAKFDYSENKRLHQLINGGKGSINPVLLRKINAAVTPVQLAKLEAAKEAYDKVTETLSMKDSFKSKEWKSLVKIENAMKKKEDDRIEAMSVIRQQMLKMSKEEATAYAEKITISPSAQHNSTSLKTSLAEVYMVIGPRDLKIDRIEQTDFRAYASQLKRYINSGLNLGEEHFKATLFHEVGHFMEWERSAESLTRRWVQQRGTGPVSPMKGYSDKERATPDHFMDQYVGKDYLSSTEVLSMGLQQFHSPRAMLDLYKADREHFFLTVGLINNDKV
jgi:hypothetical protein